MTSELVDSEMQDPPSPFEKRKYRAKFRCAECGHTWTGKWHKAPPKADEPCPNPSCAQVRQLKQANLEIANLKRMIAEGRPPAHVGSNNQVKAVDFTAEAVMQDYGLTDLKDNIRQGESMAPKLAPAAQQAADNYFAPPKVDQSLKMRDMGSGRMRVASAAQLNKIAERARAGAYARRGVNPTEVLPEKTKHLPPLQVARVEKNPLFRGS